jgi:hypothetical protein
VQQHKQIAAGVENTQGFNRRGQCCSVSHTSALDVDLQVVDSSTSINSNPNPSTTFQVTVKNFLKELTQSIQQFAGEQALLCFL